MEVRNTPPGLPLEKLPSRELVEEICTALRDVATRESYGVTPSSGMVKAIERVQTIYREIARRNLSFEGRIRRLSEQTSWQMERLLQESLSWPQVTPRVRAEDGILRYRRCRLCQGQEYPEPGEIPLCDGCLERVLRAASDRAPIDGVFLYRTYNPSYWCPHASADTVLATLDSYDLPGASKCAECLAFEYQRRRDLDPATESRG